MISYKLQFPSAIVNGRPASWTSRAMEFSSIEDVRAELAITSREFIKHARIWRITEEEIDIDKEDW